MQCQCEDSGQRSLGENTVSGVKATRAAHRSKDSRQRSHGSDSQAGSRCSYTGGLHACGESQSSSAG